MREKEQIPRPCGIRTKVTVPLVTLAIPTYNRAGLLRNALACAVAQDYPNLEILVSDNATPNNASDVVIAEFAAMDSRIVYFRQKTNIGGQANFRFLLDRAGGEYFAWLADDDFITPNYVSELARLLASDSSISCAFSRYKHISPIGVVSERQYEFSSRSMYARCLDYMFGPDDGFIYGLHRTELLRSITFVKWWWPNDAVMLNTAYPFLFEVLCEGRICLTPDKSVAWVSGDCAQKNYPIGKEKLGGFIQFVIRRANLYAEYVRRAISRNLILLALLVLLVSPAALIKDYYLCVRDVLVKRWRSNRFPRLWA